MLNRASICPPSGSNQVINNRPARKRNTCRPIASTALNQKVVQAWRKPPASAIDGAASSGESAILVALTGAEGLFFIRDFLHPKIGDHIGQVGRHAKKNYLRQNLIAAMSDQFHRGGTMLS